MFIYFLPLIFYFSSNQAIFLNQVEYFPVPLEKKKYIISTPAYVLCSFYFILFSVFFHYHCLPLYFPSNNHHTVVHVHESFILSAQSLQPLTPPTTSCHLLSICESVLLVQFVHYIPHMREIIRYLSSSDWLISLSIMLSRAIHTVAKGKIFFLFMVE